MRIRGNFTAGAKAMILYDDFETYIYNISTTSLWGQWVELTYHFRYSMPIQTAQV